jgi:hypothetical protein
MSRLLNFFTEGYSKAICLFPDYTQINCSKDWENIGMDLRISFKKYEKKRTVQKDFSEWKKKQRTFKKNKA